MPNKTPDTSRCTAPLALLGMPAIVTQTFPNVVGFGPPPLRPGEILPNPNFSPLKAASPYLVGIRPHREGGVCLKLEDG